MEDLEDPEVPGEDLEMSLEEEDPVEDFKEMIITDILETMETTEGLIEIDTGTGATRETTGGMTGEETGGIGDLMTGDRQDQRDHASSGWSLASARRREDAGFLILPSTDDSVPLQFILFKKSLKRLIMLQSTSL